VHLAAPVLGGAHGHRVVRPRLVLENCIQKYITFHYDFD
jgi:hypothetical protein